MSHGSWPFPCCVAERLFCGRLSVIFHNDFTEARAYLKLSAPPCVSVCVGVLEQPKVPDRGWSYISAKSTKMPWVVGEGKGKGGLER